MKDRNSRQRNKQKNHQSIRDSKWGNWRESRIKQRDGERGRERQKRAEEIYMPGEECCISSPVPLCHLNHCRFLMPKALLYKAQTAAGFSTLLPWNWINTMLVHVFTVISQHPEGPALTGRRPPVTFCSLLWGAYISWYGQYMSHRMQNSTSLGNKFVIQFCSVEGWRPNPKLLQLPPPVETRFFFIIYVLVQ